MTVDPAVRRVLAAALYNLAGTLGAAAQEVMPKRPPRQKPATKLPAKKPDWYTDA